MDTASFDYHLPPELIAQFPAARRTDSRLLCVDSESDARDAFEEIKFREIGLKLRRGDVLVANDTRVLPARLAARKPSGGAVEIFLERITGEHTALVQLRANKPLRMGQVLCAGAGEWIVRERRDEFYVIECGDAGAAAQFRQHGATPLPPYITRDAAEQDAARYQTVYAREEGAVAAPTAGLHFDRALINELQCAGVDWVAITLHVGAGTFQPVRASMDAHRMHREWVEVGAHACERIAHAKSRGGRVVAVGTSVVRALESAARDGELGEFSGDTELFIRPGHRFRAVDALITNFHLPKSTLLMLVCAFAGFDLSLRAYQYAVQREFRFYSYGDAMFVERLK